MTFNRRDLLSLLILAGIGILGFSGVLRKVSFDPFVAHLGEIAHRAALRAVQEGHGLQNTRLRLANEDTARFVDEQMPSLQQSRDKFDLLRTSLNAVTIDGLYGEFGVFKGATVNFIADAVPQKTIHGFDSFEGLPEDWVDGYPKGAFRVKGLPPVLPNVKLHKGWFDQTLPGFLADNKGPVAFLHMDADLYSSTKTVLGGLADRIVRGSVIQFDEFFGYPGWKHGEYKAFKEFIDSQRLRFRYLGYSTQQVAVVIE